MIAASQAKTHSWDIVIRTPPNTLCGLWPHDIATHTNIFAQKMMIVSVEKCAVLNLISFSQTASVGSVQQ